MRFVLRHSALNTNMRAAEETFIDMGFQLMNELLIPLRRLIYVMTLRSDVLFSDASILMQTQN